MAALFGSTFVCGCCCGSIPERLHFNSHIWAQTSTQPETWSSKFACEWTQFSDMAILSSSSTAAAQRHARLIAVAACQLGHAETRSARVQGMRRPEDRGNPCRDMSASYKNKCSGTSAPKQEAIKKKTSPQNTALFSHGSQSCS